MAAVNGLRVLAGVQSIAGGVLLAAPDTVASAVRGHRTPPARWLVRLLGVRVLAQGLVLSGWPEARIGALGSAVDAAHAVSMVAVAAARPAYRPAAISSAVAAAASAALGVTAARGHR